MAQTPVTQNGQYVPTNGCIPSRIFRTFIVLSSSARCKANMKARGYTEADLIEGTIITLASVLHELIKE